MLAKHVWPAGRPALQARTAVAVSCLLGAKVANVQVHSHPCPNHSTCAPAAFPMCAYVEPYVKPQSCWHNRLSGALACQRRQVPIIFKWAIDEMNEGCAAAALSHGELVLVPVGLLLSYGAARIAASAMKEMQSAVFAKVGRRISSAPSSCRGRCFGVEPVSLVLPPRILQVAAHATRTEGTRTFRHVLSLDHSFHASRQVPALCPSSLFLPLFLHPRCRCRFCSSGRCRCRSCSLLCPPLYTWRARIWWRGAFVRARVRVWTVTRREP
jgi:hypothetical protein